MRWFGGGSDNIEDRRGMSGGGKVALGGGATIIVVILGLLFGKNPNELLSQMGGAAPTEQQGKKGEPTDAEGQAVSEALKSTEVVWEKIFQDQGRTYEEPTLVLFTDQVSAAGCGIASSAVGPFYCPADRKVYIDLSFYKELQDRFGAAGDFAQNYVIAHEVGHHVQNLLGISEKVDRLRRQSDEVESNKLSVRMELQADFFAGVWAHYLNQMKSENGEAVIEPGDIEEALNAANAIGDDRLQQESQGQVVPDAFTHGTSAQRMRWFKKGFDTGDINQGDTFNASSL
ncbi:metalloprotease [Pedobacter sp. HMF7647]|uniref:Metalloprotease n=1 Tax=Hufsiella arboris TaxID=2695275 RepID=A0A7K1Y4X8_9SPHI|nr:neutral zinc metallopeptidase [Hufsiella arboris]MXV49634.1 metalloprotease [Hufsiella arboris]